MTQQINTGGGGGRGHGVLYFIVGAVVVVVAILVVPQFMDGGSDAGGAPSKVELNITTDKK